MVFENIPAGRRCWSLAGCCCRGRWGCWEKSRCSVSSRLRPSPCLPDSVFVLSIDWGCKGRYWGTGLSLVATATLSCVTECEKGEWGKYWGTCYPGDRVCEGWVRQILGYRLSCVTECERDG